MKQNRFSSFKRLKSFTHAFNGLIILIKEEHNARIHLFASIIVVIASFAFEINNYEWVAVIGGMGFVIMAEIFNSAIESVCDFISPEQNEKIKKIKDLLAAAVLISAIAALGIGLIIFIPKLIAMAWE